MPFLIFLCSESAVVDVPFSYLIQIIQIKLYLMTLKIICYVNFTISHLLFGNRILKEFWLRGYHLIFFIKTYV